jgi:type IV secretion system protein VirB4
MTPSPVLSSYLPWIYAAVGVVIAALTFFEIRGGTALLSLKKRRMRFSRGHASALLYRSLIRPNLIKLANGAYMAMYEVRAPDAGVYDPAYLAQVEVGLARAISVFNERMVVHMYQQHGTYSEYDLPVDGYASPALQWLDERRRLFFESGRTFRSKRYLTVAWLPPSERTERFRAVSSVGESAAVRSEDELIADFEDQLLQGEQNLRSYCEVRRLGVVEQVDSSGVARMRSEMLSVLAWAISGRHANVNVPPPGQLLNGLLAETFRGGFDLKVGDLETRLIVLKQFPERTIPLIFQRLTEKKIEFSFVVRWLPLDGTEARKILNDASTEWATKSQESMARMDSYSIEMRASAEEAMRFLSHGGKFGIVNPYIVLRSPDKRRVEEVVKVVIALLDEIGFKGMRATLTSEDDYFASLPGDGYHGVRKYPMNAINVTHMFSFHEESSGTRRYVDSPTLPRRSPAIAYAVSGMADTLYHVHLNDEPRDLFHHFGVGGTGSGKSVSLAFLSASWVARVPHAGFTGIDRGRSLYRLTRFLGGEFYNILGDANSPGFALFSDIDDRQLFRECLTEIEVMVMMQNIPGGLNAHRTERLQVALENMLNIEPSLRSLSTYYDLLQDPEGVLRPAIRAYTRHGILGSALDTPVDSFQTGFFNVIEIGSIFGMEPKYLIPMLRIIFWKARTQVRRMKERTGNFDLHWLYEVDEAHTLLKHPLGAQFIRDMLKMGRKEKLAIGLWSNAAADFADSEILNDIQEACKTRFYFRNSEVIDDQKVREKYESLGLTRHGIDSLPYIPSRSFMVHQPVSREMQELNWRLDDAWLAIIGRSRDTDNRRLDEFIARYPATWRIELLKYEGVNSKAVMELAAMLEEAERQGTESGLTSLDSLMAAS